MHDAATSLTSLAVVVAVAVLLGMVLKRLRQPAMVGYILAGVVLGPTALRLVEDTESIRLLAELGVLMLLFIIGMELSLHAFVRVLKPAGLTVLGQLTTALLVTLAFGWVLDWPIRQAILLAFLIALSSTAVAMKMLEDIGELRTPIGQIAIGVLIAQDLAIVPMLIFVESFGGAEINWFLLAVKIIIALGIMGGLIYYFGRRGKLALRPLEAIRGNVDLMTLAALTACFAAAAVSGVAGLSPAYGAFLAGLFLGNTTVRKEAIHVTEPIQSVLLVVFFLSIGLLLDLTYIWENLATVVLFTIGVLALKTAINVLLLHLVGQPWENAFPAGLVTAQIGEFSFVLAAAGLASAAIDPDGYRLAISVIAASLLISPLWLTTVRRFHVVTLRGMSSFKNALIEVYAGELEDLRRGRDAAVAVARNTRARGQAFIAKRRGAKEPPDQSE